VKVAKIAEMTRGWFVGNFLPVGFSTENCEVAFKKYNSQECEKKHVHKIATEITLIIRGTILMNSKEYRSGDIIILEPGEPADFKSITETETVVVKVPAVKNDKYFI